MDETYFRNLTVTFNSYTGIKKPDMTNSDKFLKYTHQENSSSDQEKIFT